MNWSQLRALAAEIGSEVTASVARGEQQPRIGVRVLSEWAERLRAELPEAHVGSSLSREFSVATAGTLSELYDARPEDMPVIEWSAKVAAVVEAARAWCSSNPGSTDGLVAAVDALDGRS